MKSLCGLFIEGLFTVTGMRVIEPPKNFKSRQDFTDYSISLFDDLALETRVAINSLLNGLPNIKEVINSDGSICKDNYRVAQYRIQNSKEYSVEVRDIASEKLISMLTYKMNYLDYA